MAVFTATMAGAAGFYMVGWPGIALAFIELIAIIPSAIRDSGKKIRLETWCLADSEFRSALPTVGEVRLYLSGEFLGADIGSFSFEGDALVFTGNQSGFVLYRDMVEPTAKKDTNFLPDGYCISYALPTSPARLVVGIRPRSVSRVDKETGRLKRLFANWEEGPSRRTIEPVLPPSTPSDEAKLSVISTYIWTGYAFAAAALTWVITPMVLDIPGDHATKAALVGAVAFNVVVSAIFLSLGVFGIRRSLARKRFYRQFEKTGARAFAG